MADTSAAHLGSPAFLQGEFAGATFPEGPFAQARIVFGAPAPQVLRSRGPTRPSHLNNFPLGNQLTRSRLSRSDLPGRPGGRTHLRILARRVSTPKEKGQRSGRKESLF